MCLSPAFFFAAPWPLLISLCPVMCLAKHLAVCNVRAAALAPCRNMVGIHFVELPDTLTISIMADGAIGAVAHSFGFCLRRLLVIYFPH